MFTAKWRFHCAGCGDHHPEGTTARFNSDNEIEAKDCDSADTISAESVGTDFDAFNRGRAPGIAVLPRGTTHADRCNQCFMVHSPGQKGCE